MVLHSQCSRTRGELFEGGLGPGLKLCGSFVVVVVVVVAVVVVATSSLSEALE